MIRKLVSSLLCAFALLLLMGAGTASEQTTSILAEEESGAPSGSALMLTETQADLVEQSAKVVPAAASESPIEVAERAWSTGCASTGYPHRCGHDRERRDHLCGPGRNGPDLAATAAWDGGPAR